MSSKLTSRLRLNRNMLGKLVVVAVMMFGFGYALVPVYRQMCELLGINVLVLGHPLGIPGNSGRKKVGV